MGLYKVVPPLLFHIVTVKRPLVRTSGEDYRPHRIGGGEKTITSDTSHFFIWNLMNSPALVRWVYKRCRETLLRGYEPQEKMKSEQGNYLPSNSSSAAAAAAIMVGIPEGQMLLLANTVDNAGDMEDTVEQSGQLNK